MERMERDGGCDRERERNMEAERENKGRLHGKGRDICIEKEAALISLSYSESAAQLNASSSQPQCLRQRSRSFREFTSEDDLSSFIVNR